MNRPTAILAAIVLAFVANIASAMNDKSIEVTRVVNAPVQQAWNTWTTPEGFKAAFGADLTVEMRPGGKYEVIWVPDAPEGQRGSEGCTVLSFIPNRMFSFTWNAPPQFGDARGRHTYIVIEFTPLGPDRTQVTLRHLGWPDDLDENMQGAFDYFAPIWPRLLDRIVLMHDDAQFEQTPEQRTQAALRAAHCYLFVEPVRPDLFQTMTEEEQKAFADHFQYLKNLTEQGKVIFAGPCTDMIGPGIVILHEPDEAKAREIMENDPVVKRGVLKAKLHPLALSLLRERDA